MPIDAIPAGGPRSRRARSGTQQGIGIGVMLLARRFESARLREATGAGAAVAGGLFVAMAVMA